MGDHGEFVLALTCGVPETVAGDLGRFEDGGINLCLFVCASTWNDGSLDSESCSVSSCISLNYCNLAVCGNERGYCCESQQKFVLHVEELERLNLKKMKKINECMDRPEVKTAEKNYGTMKEKKRKDAR